MSRYRLPPTRPVHARPRSEEGGLEPTGNLPNASQANLCSLSDRGGPFEEGGCIPRKRKEGTLMSWTTPTLVEVCIGLEINGYLPAEF